MHVDDPWQPMPLEEIVGLFTDAPFRWWLAGGLALELHVGASWRDHEDADVGVRRSDAAAIHGWMDRWEMAVAAGGRLTPWGGGPLEEERSQNNVWVRRDSSFVLDLTIGSGDDESWIYRRDPSIRRPWADAVLRTAAGVPYLAADLQLLFKSKRLRPKDDEDARIVIPLLDERAREFLGAALPDRHPWRSLLAG